MKISIISDTHNKHKLLTSDLPGGDLILHAGDLSSMGYVHEIKEFCKWYDSLDYDVKVFIAGNHDFGFQDNISDIMQEVNSYKTIDYLQDSEMNIQIPGEPNVKIYGSPWQPEFYNWAFNLPRNGKELEAKWNAIPEDTDILITHGPAWGFVDGVEGRRGQHLGCELLAERIKVIKPKIHICGHIHTGHGHYFDGHTHYINASVLNERYLYSHTPFNIDWNPVTNEIIFH